MSGPVHVEDPTIAAVVVAMASENLIADGERGGVADLLATLNRRQVAAEYKIMDAKGDPVVPPPVLNHPWRWRPLASALEVLTRLDFLLANIGTEVSIALIDDLIKLREATIRRIPGYGDSMWRR
jgi:hypothetical protein